MLVLFFRPQDTFPVLEPLHLGYVTAAFALSTLVMGRLARGAAVSCITPELLAVLALGGVMLATAPFSIWPGGAVGVFTDLYWKVILVFALMVNTVTTRARFRRLVTVVVLGTSYIAVRAVTDYARGVNLVEDGRVSGAVGGLFGNPNDMALNMVTFLPLAVALAIVGGRPLVRALALVGVPAIAAAIVFSKSRGGTIGLVTMLLVLLYKVSRLRPGIVAVVGLAVCLATIPLLPASFTARMSSIFNPRKTRRGHVKRAPGCCVKATRRSSSIRSSGSAQDSSRTTSRTSARSRGARPITPCCRWPPSWASSVSSSSSSSREVDSQPSSGARPPSGERVTAISTARGRAASSSCLAPRWSPSLTGWLAAAMFASVAYYWTLYLVLGLAAAFRDIIVREDDVIKAGGVPVRLRAA